MNSKNSKAYIYFSCLVGAFGFAFFALRLKETKGQKLQ